MKKYLYYIFLLGSLFQATAQNTMQTIENIMPEKLGADSLELYVYENCPYCIKVLLFLHSQNMLDAVQIMHLGVKEYQDALQQMSGKLQAPYLVDRSCQVQMAESDDIIAYIMKKYDITYAASAFDLPESFDNAVSQQIYNPETFMQDVIASEKSVIILISTTWCPPCKLFKPIFLQVAQLYAEQYNFICVDGDANRSIIEQLGVTCYPSVVCYKNGQVVKINDDQKYRSYQGLIKLIESL